MYASLTDPNRITLKKLPDGARALPWYEMCLSHYQDDPSIDGHVGFFCTREFLCTLRDHLVLFLNSTEG